MDMRNTSTQSIPYFATALTMAHYLDLALARQMQTHHERDPSPHTNLIPSTRQGSGEQQAAFTRKNSTKIMSRSYPQRLHQKHHHQVHVCTIITKVHATQSAKRSSLLSSSSSSSSSSATFA
eukprot:1153787-Pelagomonas_calceolata.AAC.3